MIIALNDGEFMALMAWFTLIGFSCVAMCVAASYVMNLFINALAGLRVRPNTSAIVLNLRTCDKAITNDSCIICTCEKFSSNAPLLAQQIQAA